MSNCAISRRRRGGSGVTYGRIEIVFWFESNRSHKSIGEIYARARGNLWSRARALHNKKNTNGSRKSEEQREKEKGARDYIARERKARKKNFSSSRVVVIPGDWIRSWRRMLRRWLRDMRYRALTFLLLARESRLDRTSFTERHILLIVTRQEGFCRCSVLKKFIGIHYVWV